MLRYLFAPRMSPVSLPAESPRPASAIPDWQPSSYTYRPTPASPVAGFQGNYDHHRTRNYPASSRHPEPTHSYDPSIQYERAGSFGPGAYGSFAPSEPPPASRARSKTPAPLIGILKSSRTRSLSTSSNPETLPRPSSAASARPEPRKSSLSKPHIVTVRRTAPLKEESISLNWPLVQFGARRRLKKPLLYFDAGFDPRDPSNLRDKSSGQWYPMSQVDRMLPASTHCVLKKMVILCPHIGEITIRRSNGITCIDIFAEIYDAYHKRLGRDEWPRDIDRYTLAFEQRCTDSGRPAERSAGLRRVDLLRGKRIFDGLSRAGADWRLMFES
ncbi:hypothetical protein C8R47DRAFT_1128183 [Mycena vitilis]|nr:hypothetical protein C8R47DRAFT_1128183 [Mycena vitilis]